MVSEEIFIFFINCQSVYSKMLNSRRIWQTYTVKCPLAKSWFSLWLVFNNWRNITYKQSCLSQIKDYDHVDNSSSYRNAFRFWSNYVRNEQI